MRRSSVRADWLAARGDRAVFCKHTAHVSEAAVQSSLARRWLVGLTSQLHERSYFQYERTDGSVKSDRVNIRFKIRFLTYDK